jgi:hypothetical protein
MEILIKFLQKLLFEKFSGSVTIHVESGKVTRLELRPFKAYTYKELENGDVDKKSA